MTEFQKLKALADNGDCEACFQYAERARAYQDKVSYYTMSLTGGCTKAAYPLSQLLAMKKYAYLNNEQISSLLNDYVCQNYLRDSSQMSDEEVISILNVAASHCLSAKLSLAYCYFNGVGVKKNNNKGHSILLDAHVYGTFTAFKSSTCEGLQFTPPKSKKATKMRQKQQIIDIVRWPLNLLFHPYISIYAGTIELDLHDNTPEGERGVGDALGGCVAIIVGMFLYFAILNVGIYYVLKWTLGYCGFWTFLIESGILLALSIFYLSISGKEFKEREKKYKEMKNYLKNK